MLNDNKSLQYSANNIKFNIRDGKFVSETCFKSYIFIKMQNLKSEVTSTLLIILDMVLNPYALKSSSRPRKTCEMGRLSDKPTLKIPKRIFLPRSHEFQSQKTYHTIINESTVIIELPQASHFRDFLLISLVTNCGFPAQTPKSPLPPQKKH